VDFQTSKNWNLVKAKFLKFYHPYTLPGSCEVPHKIWVRSVEPFLSLLNTNKQTSKPPIYYFTCKHVLFEYIVQQNNFMDLIKKIVDFHKLSKSNFVRGKFWKIRSTLVISWGHARLKKLGPIGSAVLAFIGYKQAKYKYRWLIFTFLRENMNFWPG